MIVYTFYTKASEEKNWWRRTDNQPVGCGTSAGSQFHWQQINFEQTDCNRDTTRVLIFSLNFHGFILFSTSIIHAHKSKCFQNSWIYECFRFRSRWDCGWILLIISWFQRPEISWWSAGSSQSSFLRPWSFSDVIRCECCWYMLLWALTRRTYPAVRGIFSPTCLYVWNEEGIPAKKEHYDASLPAWPR